MRKQLTAIFLFLTTIIYAAQIGEWRSHLAYNHVTHVARLGEQIFALAGGSLYSIDTEDGSMAYYNKQNSLHGSTISYIAANRKVGVLTIFYSDGLIDLMSEDGTTTALTDLLLKDMSADKKVNSVSMKAELAYCSMPFGIMVLNLKRQEITGVYYIGEDGKEENVLQTAIIGDSIYAISANTFYSASLKDNVQDYNSWQRLLTLPETGNMQRLVAYNDEIWILQNGHLYQKQGDQWQAIPTDDTLTDIVDNDGLFAFAGQTVYERKDNKWNRTTLSVNAYDVFSYKGGLWIAAGDKGVAYHTNEGDEYYQPDGPAVNIPYRMKVMNDKLYVVPGARWATESRNPGYVMIYDGERWTNINNEYITSVTGTIANDFMNVAVDPQNEEHFYVTSYGTGVYEFEGTTLVKRYTHTNSPLSSAVSDRNIDFYVRTDGALFDAEGNLWLLNTSSNAHNIHILSPSQREAARNASYAKWDTLNLYESYNNRVVLSTPLEMIIDKRYSQWKWIPSGRSQPGIILLDDNGTPARGGDDRVVFRTQFTDQDGNVLRPEMIFAVEQDKENTLWVGTNAGIFIIPADVDFRKSDRCERIKIARNDGTNLADYLLSTEQINAIVADGSNRKWIATDGSGVYLMSEDGTETIEHFTTDNSPLLSNKVLSIAIQPSTGMVFIGTDNGLMSYQSDAAEPQESYSSAYVYPNPVRENYDGVITFAGLMDETVIHIVDQAGNLVCETRSNGGLAIWDGKNGAGKRVSTGVYSALCNTADGKKHTVLKVLVIH